MQEQELQLQLWVAACALPGTNLAWSRSRRYSHFSLACNTSQVKPSPCWSSSVSSCLALQLCGIAGTAPVKCDLLKFGRCYATGIYGRDVAEELLSLEQFFDINVWGFYYGFSSQECGSVHSYIARMSQNCPGNEYFAATPVPSVLITKPPRASADVTTGASPNACSGVLYVTAHTFKLPGLPLSLQCLVSSLTSS